MKKNLEWQEKNTFIFGISMFVWIETLVHKESIETINTWNHKTPMSLGMEYGLEMIIPNY